MILKTSHSTVPSNDTSSCQRRPWPALQKRLSLALSPASQTSLLESAGEPSCIQPFPHDSPVCVSLFLNIFSLRCCVFILSERGRCYGLHTTFVYGFFNQDQITESCLHLWAHPQKLGVYVCVSACCSPLTIPPQRPNKYSPSAEN